MVGTVDLSMAILTAAIDEAFIGTESTDQIRSGQQIVGVTDIGMTLLAQKRSSGDQQHLMVGAVRLMTVETVFPHRGMFPDERATFFRMALITHLINRIGF